MTLYVSEKKSTSFLGYGGHHYFMCTVHSASMMDWAGSGRVGGFPPSWVVLNLIVRLNIGLGRWTIFGLV